MMDVLGYNILEQPLEKRLAANSKGSIGTANFTVSILRVDGDVASRKLSRVDVHAPLTAGVAGR